MDERRTGRASFRQRAERESRRANAIFSRVARSTRYQVLLEASEAATMWELPWTHSTVVDGELREDFPASSVEEMQRVLIDLLREGHVQLYLDDSGPVILDVDAAVEAAARAQNWDPDEGDSVGYLLTTTESGERELQAMYEAEMGE